MTPSLHQPATTISSESATTSSEIVTWSVHLLRRDPRRLTTLLGCFAAVTICAGVWFHSLLAALIPAAAFVLSLAEYLFPITYTLTDRFARSVCGPIVLEMPWADVRHAYLAADGVKLSPLRKPGSRFEAMRGIFLRFDGNEDAVVDAVRRLRKGDQADG